MKRTISNPSYYIGKKLNPNKWNIPEGYELCAKTGKFLAVNDLLATFAHWLFDRSWLIEKSIMVEDAQRLSGEGYDEIMDVLKHEGQWTRYIERDAA